MISIDEYTDTVGYRHRRNLAQFFTPPEIARFMVGWVARDSGLTRIHDPAFGLGAFFLNAPAGCRFSGTEIDDAVLEFFGAHSPQKPDGIARCDYLLDFDQCYDNIVCNPPYLRFQKFLNRDAVFKAFRERLDVRLSGYTNIASAFLVKSISELREGGRLAYILPSEFLNSGYGSLVKDWLIKDRHLDSIIEVACENEAFWEVTTSVCIVLYDSMRRMESVTFRRIASLDEISDVLKKPPIRTVSQAKLDVNEKWGKYFVPAEESIRPSASLLTTLSEYGRFSRGIATGANEFFVLSKSGIVKNGLSEESYVPCITKSQQLTGLTFTDDDFEELARKNKAVYLFSPKGEPDEASLRYIRFGEEKGYNNRFITRHRNPWYKTESRAVSPILLNVFSRSGYKVVRNRSSALSLTNFHCFYPHPLRKGYVDWLFLYLHSGVGRRLLSLSKRRYGNALDKFEPNDLNGALVPTRDFFDSLGSDILSSMIGAVNRRENVDDRLDTIFRQLLLRDGAEFGENGETGECGSFTSAPVLETQQVSRGKHLVQMTFFEPSVYVVEKSPLTLLASYRRDCKGWIVQNGLYNYPITKRQFESDARFIQAKRLILQNRRSRPMCFSVKGCEFVTRKQLEKLGYPRKGTHGHYLLFRIEPVEDFTVQAREGDFSVLVGKGCSYDEFIRIFHPCSGSVQSDANPSRKKRA